MSSIEGLVCTDANVHGLRAAICCGKKPRPGDSLIVVRVYVGRLLTRYVLHRRCIAALIEELPLDANGVLPPVPKKVTAAPVQASGAMPPRDQQSSHIGATTVALNVKPLESRGPNYKPGTSGSGDPDQISVNPLLADALAEPVMVPTPFDWSFRSSEPQSAGGGFRSNWAEAQQALFEDECWSPEAEKLAGRLIRDYEFMWPWAFERLAQARVPEVKDGVEAAYDSGRLLVATPSATVSTAMLYGPFDRMCKLTSWPGPTPIDCAICRGRFQPEGLAYWMIRQYGPPRYCPACCGKAYRGRLNLDIETIRAGIVQLSSMMEAIPSQDAGARIVIGGFEPVRRDRLMSAFITTPSRELAFEVLGGANWTEVLRNAGVIGTYRRGGRGTYCTAKDGHACRSLAELSIDDFLFESGIAHTPEPPWPRHSVLNPHGRRRADWKLADGTYVEYAGMLSDAEYAKKMSDKRTLADALDLRLLILVPEDLRNLRATLAPWMA